MSCIPSQEKILEMVRNNINLPNVNIALEELKTKITSLTEGANGIVDALGSIQSQVQGQIDSVTAVVQEAEANLHRSLQEALAILQRAPDEFVAEMERLRDLFPSADIDEILDSICEGTFSLENIPDIDIFNGEEIRRALSEIVPTESPIDLPDFPEIPEITFPDIVPEVVLNVESLRISSNGALLFANTLVELGHRLGALRSRL